MNYEISVLNDDTIILVTATPDFNFNGDIENMQEAVLAILEAADHPFALIIDTRALKPDFSTLVSAMYQGTRGSFAMFGHAALRQHIFITENPMVKIGAKAFSQEQYGGIQVTVVSTLEEALAAVDA